MSRDSASLLDIYAAGQNVLAYAQGLSQAELEADGMRLSAILYQILIVGEATKRLSSEFRSQHPEIPWDDIAGMRDVLAHQYDRVNFKILWRVIQHSFPELLDRIAPLLPDEPSDSIC